ncbi:MAG: AI-2E family transporter [Spirosomataceae bacterium]
MTKHFSNTNIRQFVFIFLILLLGGLLAWNLQGFLPALLGAYTLYVLLHQGMVQLTERFKWKSSRAAFCLMLGSLLVLAIPLYFLGQIIFNLYPLIVQQYHPIFEAIKAFTEGLEKRFDMKIFDEKALTQLSTWATTTAREVLSTTFNGIATLAMMYVFLYFMLTDREHLERGFLRYMPLKRKNAEFVKEELNKAVFSNAVGIPVIALVQASAALVMYLILGVPNPMLWFVVTFIASMIPIVGSILAYVPVSILLYTTKGSTQAIIMLAYGLLVIGSVDNIFRIWLQNKLGDAHPLVTLFGVIVGSQLFGFIGLIFGPILISTFVLFLKIYQLEFPSEEGEE